MRILSTRVSAQALDVALLVCRLSIGGVMLTHGLQKISMFNTHPVQFVDFMGFGPEISLGLTVFAEVVCSILLIVGFATRLAAIPLIITMLTALLLVHAADPFEKQEMALHYLLVYVVLLLLGSGRYAVDAVFDRTRI